MRDIDNYFLSRQEPARSILGSLRSLILGYDPGITEVWRYRMPFYCFNGWRFCYLWQEKDNGKAYLGFVDGNLITHPDLVAEDRKRMRVLKFDPNLDLPIEKINSLLGMAIDLLPDK
ncbi:hypothetical protein DYBT9275_01083 [Dyadobacter sp. CECT 9275]|uniref:YdhG-like domain-containing protein n=1 Tax=Dyadobacter helix TaxID=2822344 RepID=A0A916J8A6_9BACT|nr:DUF1801 domain-containing protein [Dyadobacter sp. CECT 9275]CAG4992998.1 hypothetical protein DYBT9275_01083 [Dyadobacter sp. CECT 9275]